MRCAWRLIRIADASSRLPCVTDRPALHLVVDARPEAVCRAGLVDEAAFAERSPACFSGGRRAGVDGNAVSHGIDLAENIGRADFRLRRSEGIKICLDGPAVNCCTAKRKVYIVSYEIGRRRRTFLRSLAWRLAAETRRAGLKRDRRGFNPMKTGPTFWTTASRGRGARPALVISATTWRDEPRVVDISERQEWKGLAPCPTGSR